MDIFYSGFSPPPHSILKQQFVSIRKYRINLQTWQRGRRALQTVLLLLLSMFFQNFEIKAQSSYLVCTEIMILDVNGISNFSVYESSPQSSNPNTINICQPGTFEITDAYPYTPDSRCYVPVGEGNEEQNWFMLYLMTTNLNAALPTPGSIVPQTGGDWTVVLNASNIPGYNTANFPPFNTGFLNTFTISTPGSYAIIGAICELDGSNNFRIINSNIANPTDPVSNKIFLNYLDTATPLQISGDQHLCEGASNVYSIPAYLANLNPQWTVTGGTFTGSGASIQVNWTFPAGAIGTVSVQVTIGEELCELSASKAVYQCCELNELNVYNLLNANISETPLAGLGVANPANTNINYLVVNGFLHIDEDIEIQDIELFMGPFAKITVADNVTFKTKDVQIAAICEIMYDGVYASNPSQQIELENTSIVHAINGVVSEKGGIIRFVGGGFNHNWVGLTIRDYNPSQVAGYDGNVSPVEIYGADFLPYSPALPPYQNVAHPLAAVKIDNVGFVTIGVRNQAPNLFNPLLGTPVNMSTAILMNNSGGNIVNNEFHRINVVGSPSVSGAILATISQPQAWMRPLQIGRLWSGGAAGDANYFDQGYQAIRTTNIQSLFIRYNTFKDFSSNITVINGGGQRVIQGNAINFQLGSPSTPNRSSSGIMVTATHGIPTAGGGIWENHVEACAQGILLNTVNSMTVSNNIVRTFSANGASQSSARAGISATNGWNVNIYMNNLQHNNLPPNSDLSGNNLRGISLNNVVDATVWDNYVLRYGSGIFAANDNRVSQFRCNFLQAGIWGFNFDKVYLDQQGNTGDPTDNQWVSNRRSIRTNGTNDINMPSREWFYRSGPEFNPNTLAPTLININPILTSAGEVECSNVVLPNDTNPKDDKYEDPEIVEEVFGAVVDSSAQFSSASVQYFEESMTYRILDQNPAIIQQTSTHQQAFDDFYTTHLSGTKGDVKRLYDAFLGRAVHDVDELLNNFQPSNVFEVKIAEVSTIYAQSWFKGRFELDSAEKSVLLPIALADASIWGEAVYTSRVMLGMFDLDGNIGTGNQRRSLSELVYPEQAIGMPYPNPTTGAFAFSGNIETGFEKATIRLFDLQGRAAVSAIAIYNDGAWQIADLNLPAGMYMYEFSVDAQLMQRGKIIIK